jgi:hypothetical protein
MPRAETTRPSRHNSNVQEWTLMTRPRPWVAESALVGELEPGSRRWMASARWFRWIHVVGWKLFFMAAEVELMLLGANEDPERIEADFREG